MVIVQYQIGIGFDFQPIVVNHYIEEIKLFNKIRLK
jgi:hypothetical protein